MVENTMDISSIPKFFWYCCGFAILVATFGLTYIAYRSSEVSIEIANTKIQLSGAIADVKDAIAKVEAKTTPSISPQNPLQPSTKPIINPKEIESIKDTLNQAQQRISKD